MCIRDRYKIGEPHFRLLGTNGFHVKAENERFTASSSRCRQNLKYEHFTSSFGRLHQKACRTRSTIIFLHSTNQIIDLCRWRCRRQIFRELKQPRRRRQYLHIWQWKTAFLYALHVHFFLLTFWRRSRSFYDVKWPVLQLPGRREHTMTNVHFCLVTVSYTHLTLPTKLEV